jgi:hypothetical protein
MHTYLRPIIGNSIVLVVACRGRFCRVCPWRGVHETSGSCNTRSVARLYVLKMYNMKPLENSMSGKIGAATNVKPRKGSWSA